MIRTGQQENLREILDFIEMNIDESPETVGVIPFLEQQYNRIRYFISEDDAVNGVAGYEPETYRIVILVTARDKRRQHIASDLLDRLCEEAEKENVARLFVNALPGALPFYLSYGFETYGDQVTAGDLTVTPMEFLLGQNNLGRTFTVIIDHPYGSFHAYRADEQYPVNCGYVREKIPMDDGYMQEAYICGLYEPREEFTGILAGIIYRHNEVCSRWIVIPAGRMIDQEELMGELSFEEQFYDTRWIFKKTEQA